ncbi:serine/threonine-protein kinase [Rudaea sp.]|uniref:serine/threonine-protein kinase n=1 Tax=Rudaea sp. TaxID=2136325 RepID=UPI002ED619A6
MGEVYAALRADAGFTQRGALKLLRFDAIGELQRFHAERQILARLDHPGIARLLDGGVAPDGRPYTVMEFVEGVSLLDYCNARKATIDERLDLFAQVCDAVAYAHRNLVIHRDLKPANTLVDAEGKVKLLDFGIAKLIDTAAANNSDATATVAPFTLDYAAPEQLTGEPVTTATDVYTLGVLLFELLTGERPLRKSGLPSTQALALLDREAPFASRVVRDKADAPVPASALAGDLDTIIAKCLRRESAHRYDTVNGLKLDLQRHRAREPVLAREGARMYVFGRVLRRYRWAVAAAAALIFALAVGLGGTLWQANRAQTQARLAEAQASRAEAAKNFLLSMFKASDPRQASDKPRGGITARELLDASAPRIERDFTTQPELQIELLGTITQIFSELREPEHYTAFHAKYMELARQHYGELHPVVIDGYLRDAAYAAEHSDLEGLKRVLEQVDPLIQKAGLDHSPMRARWWVLKSETLMSDKTGQAERESMLLRAVALYESTQRAEEEYVEALGDLGNIYGSDRADRARGREFHRRAKAALALLPERNDVQDAIIELNLAVEANELGDFAEADASFERAAKLYLQTYAEHHPLYWTTLAFWADAVCRHGDRERANHLFERMLSVLPANPGADEAFYLARAQRVHGICLADQGRVREATPVLEAVERKSIGTPIDLARARQALGDVYDRANRSDDARRMLKQAVDDQLELATKINALDNAGLLGARERWGRFLLAHGELEEAERQFRETIARDHDRNLEAAALTYGDLAQLTLLRGDANAAAQASAEALNAFGKVSGKRNVRTEPYLWRIRAQALARTGDLTAAHDYAQRALDAFRRYDDPESTEIAKSAAVLAEIDGLAKK